MLATKTCHTRYSQTFDILVAKANHKPSSSTQAETAASDYDHQYSVYGTMFFSIFQHFLDFNAAYINSQIPLLALDLLKADVSYIYVVVNYISHGQQLEYAVSLQYIYLQEDQIVEHHYLVEQIWHPPKVLMVVLLHGWDTLIQTCMINKQIIIRRETTLTLHLGF